jgi:ribosomal protein L27
MLGIKLFGGQRVSPSGIICRQNGTRWRAGKNTYYSRNWSIHAKIHGSVYFDQKWRRINVCPIGGEFPGAGGRTRTADLTVSPELNSTMPPKSGDARTGPSSHGMRSVGISEDLSPESDSEAGGIFGRFLIRMLQEGDNMSEIRDLAIRSDASLHASDPGFGAKSSTSERVLRVPTALCDILTSLSIETASGLVSLARTFPTALAARLHWKHDRVVKECDYLVANLSALVDPELLELPPNSRPPVLGVRSEYE